MCHIIIFKFVPAGMVNAERNLHNLEMFGIWRKRSQGSSLWNEITYLNISWGNFVNVMSRLRGGGQGNNVLVSPRGKDSSLKPTGTVCGPCRLLLLPLPRFRATDLLNLRTTVLKSKILLILSFPLLLNSVRRCLTFTSIRSTHLKLSNFPYCNTE